jgi:hypothetical protein
MRCMRNWTPEGAPTPEEQLTRWVAGESVCPNTRHECCPDFSCCRPALGWPIEKRKKFQAATQGEREKMMMGSLGALAEAVGKKAYITRGNPKDHE